MSPSIIILVYGPAKNLLHTWIHFRLKNIVNPMQQLYASRTFWHVAFQKPDFANFPDVVTYQKNMASAKNLLWRFFYCKIVTGLKIIFFYSLSVRTCKTWFSYFCASPMSQYLILINFNVKVIFYMFQQFSNTFGLVKYIYEEAIQKRTVLRFFCGSVYSTSLNEVSRSTSAQSVSRNLLSNLINFWNRPYSWLNRSSSCKIKLKSFYCFPFSKSMQ